MLKMQIKDFIKKYAGYSILLLIAWIAIICCATEVLLHKIHVKELENKRDQILEESKQSFDELKEKMIEEYKNFELESDYTSYEVKN